MLADFDGVFVGNAFYPVMLVLYNFSVLFFDEFLHFVVEAFEITDLVLIDQPIVAEHGWLLFFILFNKRHGLLDIVKTQGRCYIYSLADIESMRETSVISFEKCTDIFTRSLVGLVNRNTIS